MSTTLDDLVARAHALVAAAGDRRTVLGVVGAPGAGKSTLVEALLGALRAAPPEEAAVAGPDWVAHLPMDGYHLADAQLDRLGRRDAKGAPDTFDARGYAATLARVRDDLEHPVYVPGFERELEQPLAAALVVPPAARLVLTEGNYLLLGADGDPAHLAQGWGEVRALLDEVWFVEVPDALRRERLVARHVRFGKTPDAAAAWVDVVDEPNARLVARGRAAADLLVDPDEVGVR